MFAMRPQHSRASRVAFLKVAEPQYITLFYQIQECDDLQLRTEPLVCPLVAKDSEVVLPFAKKSLRCHDAVLLFWHVLRVLASRHIFR